MDLLPSFNVSNVVDWAVALAARVAAVWEIAAVAAFPWQPCLGLAAGSHGFAVAGP